MSTLLWILQMAFTHFYHQRFLFRDHGFDLVSISFIGFLTLLGQQQVANAALPDATIGLGATLLLLVIILIGKARQATTAPPPVAWRLTRNCRGIGAAETPW